MDPDRRVIPADLLDDGIDFGAGPRNPVGSVPGELDGLSIAGASIEALMFSGPWSVAITPDDS
jgi:hypothetical protein